MQSFLWIISESLWQSLKTDQRTLQTECHVKSVVVNMRLFDWVVQIPLTYSRLMSVYHWRLGLHLACSGSKSCACVTVLLPCMWTDFLLWHLIWLTWHQQATEDSHNCHLLTGQRNRNRKRRKRLGGRGRGERTAMLKKTRQRREIYTELATFGREVRKRGEENIQGGRVFIFWSFRRLTTLFLSHKHALRRNNGNVVWVIHCLKFSFWNTLEWTWNTMTCHSFYINICI